MLLYKLRSMVTMGKMGYLEGTENKIDKKEGKSAACK